jgi:hypothetical protein
VANIINNPWDMPSKIDGISMNRNHLQINLDFIYKLINSSYNHGAVVQNPTCMFTLLQVTFWKFIKKMKASSY